MNVHLGFTGTQMGMTAHQRQTCRQLMTELRGTDLHHGDCVGADSDANVIAVSLGLKIHLHVPVNPTKRAFCSGDFFYQPKAYLERNHDLVNATSSLIAAPETTEERHRSGTWATIRYARAHGKPLYIVWPDGSVARENLAEPVLL